MAKYEITSPDGQKFEITAPDDATQDQVMSYARSQFKQQSASASQKQPTLAPPNFAQKIIGSKVGSFVQGAGDFLWEGAEMLPAALKNITSLGGYLPNPVSDTFKKDQEFIAGLSNKVRQDYKTARDLVGRGEGTDWMRLAGNVAGPMSLGPAVARGITKAPTIGEMVKTGANMGAMGGLLSSSEDRPEGVSLEQYKAESAVLGGMAGAVANPILTKLVTKAASLVGGWANKYGQNKVLADLDKNVDTAVRMAVKEAGQNVDDLPSSYLTELRSQVAQAVKGGKQLDAKASIRAMDFKNQGMPYTLGQVSRDPSQFAMERNLRAVPEAGKDLLNLFNYQNQRLNDDIGRMAGNKTPFEAGKTITGTLKAIDENIRANVSKAYEVARNSAGKDLDIPMQGLSQDYAKVLFDFADKVPSGVRNHFESYGLLTGKQAKTFTINDAEKLLKVINDNMGSDKATNTALGALRTAVKNAVTNVDDTGGVFANARSMAAGRFKLHEAIPALERAANGEIAPEEFVDKFVVKGNVSEVQRLGKILKGTPAFKEIRQQIGTVLQRAAFGENVSGDKNIRPETFNKVIRQIGKEKLSAFFTKSEIEQIHRLGRVSAYVNQAPSAAPVMGNPNMFWAGKLIDTASKIPGAKGITGGLLEASNLIDQRNAVQRALNPSLLMPYQLPPEVQRRINATAASASIPIGLLSAQ